MIVQVLSETCVKISEGVLSVGRACEDCNFVVYENNQIVGSFRDAISFTKFMKERYGKLGEEMSGLLCWYFYDYLDDDEIKWLKKNNKVFREKLVGFLSLDM